MSYRERESSPWGKAIVAGVVLVLFLFLLFTRSSCLSSSQTGQIAESSGGGASESQSSNGKEESDQNEDSKEDSSLEESVSGEESSQQADSKPVEESPSPDETMAAEESSSASPSGGGTPASAGSEGEGSEGEGGSSEGYAIGGLNIIAKRLGVILDTSGSMTRYLPDLRREIKANFPRAVFLEVEGCVLEPTLGSISRQSGIQRNSVMEAIQELIKVHQVDSIYWFCDLQDERTEEAVTELEMLMLSQGRPKRLFIRSTDELPGPRLERIINRSGGGFEKRR